MVAERRDATSDLSLFDDDDPRRLREEVHEPLEPVVPLRTEMERDYICGLEACLEVTALVLR
jgi:hypothetical protein